ncbi:hypothetical protein MKP05_21000 [Halomonas sp. EGI 63088]|uniref:Tetratricopeptide repeat protein n=1 Tax=Halomonas flagellata TaxID=2920385 RepID=A0ABS9S0P0_9GAMM|nr:hypothetical protein [Halomonas flagellata]MCH4565575.1 hypothetical protein [Halomonas flagellata]
MPRNLVQFQTGLSLPAFVFFVAGLSFSYSALAEQEYPQGEEMVPKGDDIGTVDFRVSCDDAVKQRFDRALGLMHHMMYEQARTEFGALTETDPNCAMAHWGVATTLFQPLWPERPDQAALQRGWDEISKAIDLEPETERERLLVDATAGFFREPDTAAYWDRIDRWAKGMAAAYEANPDDLDTAALYGLSLVAVAARAEDRNPLLDEAEAVLRAVWEEEPTHPGAIHYSIHATDVEGRAENALDLVEVYADIAPEVTHARHMPSHIYVRLGKWSEVIDWNRRSVDAALRSPVNDSISLHYLHGSDYLVYGYLQKGNDTKAQEIFEEAMAHDNHQPSFAAAFHAAAIPARLAVEQRDWGRATALEPRTPDYLPWDQSLWAEGLTWYARGLGGVHSGELDIAREAEERLKALRDQAKAEGEDVFATYLEVDRRILSGWIAHADDDIGEAIELMQSAAELEGTTEKHPITPGALLPPYEALGDLLLTRDRPAEALEAYRASDEIWPGRYNTLLGAARAAQAAEDDTAAREYYQQLLEIVGDSERDAIREAKAFVEE